MGKSHLCLRAETSRPQSSLSKLAASSRTARKVVRRACWLAAPTYIVSKSLIVCIFESCSVEVAQVWLDMFLEALSMAVFMDGRPPSSRGHAFAVNRRYGGERQGTSVLAWLSRGNRSVGWGWCT